MMKNIAALNEVINPDLEPGVISHKMLQDAYRENYKGEAGRLRDQEVIDYENILIMRLEFKNILRIDHLWVLPNLTKLSLNYNKLEKIENIEMLVNLKELDLSFNYIEKIENLETLTRLETLSLFNNLITNIENLDTLETLVILSIGNNKIDTLVGIERIRFFKKLRVLNLEGNPIADDPENPLRIYIAAVLPNLQYYNYIGLKNEERGEGKLKYVRELREIEGSEENELQMRAKRAKDLADEQRLSSSFVEFLNEHQLFESLWDGDPDGTSLRMIGEDAEELISEYKDDIYNVTQEIYLLGLVKYEERKAEIELYEKCVAKGQEKIQRDGQRIVEKFLIEKEEIHKVARVHYEKIEKLRLQGFEDTAPEIIEPFEEVERVFEGYTEQMDDLWQQLMGQEVHLYESIEEVTGNFVRNIQDLLNQFIEQVLSSFASLRDVSRTFSDQLLDAVSQYIAHEMAKGGNYEGVPKELQTCIEDKDNIIDLIDGMRNFQTQKIEDREDRLVRRSKEWVKELVETKKNDELERNRTKIIEINYFLDQMRERFQRIHSEINEELTTTA